jgi:FHS family L-fucose permease-like MFS transporter
MVFFFWGFIAASNSILIPFCKTHFSLTQFESQLIGSAFYIAYFVGSLVLFVVSNLIGTDIVNKIGYKRGIIYGLFISVIGALLIIPSANANSYYAILGSLFIVALGFSLQQTCAQPFAISLGDPATGSHRLNLGGGVNSLGTTLGPIIVSFFLFGGIGESTTVTVTNINNLYLIVAGVFAAVALFFLFSKLPDGKNEEPFEKANKASGALMVMTFGILGIILLGTFTEIAKLYLLLATFLLIIVVLFASNNSATKNADGWGAMKYPQLIYGMLGIFVYVGVEVTIDNNFGALLKQPGYFNETGLDESEISQYISLYWGSLMIGRWTGAISVFNLSKSAKRLATIVVPFVAFGIILGVNVVYGNAIGNLLPYALCIAIAIAAFFYGEDKPVKTLLTLSVLATVAMLVGVFTTGLVSVFAFISGGLCCSIMWPCIFSLGVGGLGKYTSEGSALLIMMILGGAIIPPLQGAVGDGSIGLHNSYLVAAACFAFLAVLALKLKSVLQKQGLDFDQTVAASH